MGLPPDVFALPIDPKIVPTLGPTKKGLIMMYTNEPTNMTWPQYSAKFTGSTIIFADLSWTEPAVNVMDSGSLKTGFGAFIDTHVSRKVASGDWLEFEWWHSGADLMR